VLGAVIFDFDGVIADDELLHLQGFSQALASHGISLSEQTYYDRYLGYDDHDGFVAMLEDAGQQANDAVVAELMARKAAVVRRLVEERVRIFPGVSQLLVDLTSGARPLPLAIGSGALRSEILLVLRAVGFAERFDVIVAAEDVDHGKPAPETFLTACAGLARVYPGVEPATSLVIEDSIAGLEAAAAAGMKSIGVTNSYSASELEADLVVASLEEVDRARCEALFAPCGV
jgi:beta-phosphoglucomutase